MKKVKKKLFGTLAIILSLSLLSSISIPAKAETNKSTWNLNHLQWKDEAKDKLLAEGAPEDDIENFSDSDLAKFYSSKDISVSVTYLRVDNKTGEVTQIPNDKVNALLDDIQKYKEEKFSQKIAELNPLTVINAIASASSDIELSSGGYLRQALYVATTGTTNRYNVSYTADWLIQPENTKIDLFGIAIDNAYVVKGTENSFHYAKYNCPSTNVVGGSTGVTPLTNYYYQTDGLGQSVDLFGPQIYPYIEYYNEHIYMTCDIIVNSSSATYLAVAGFYRHQETVFQVDPSISFIGTSVGISCTNSSSMNNMTPNPYVLKQL